MKNESYKRLEVTISQTLSSTQYIIVPNDFDETDYKAIEREVIDQIILPSDALEFDDLGELWIVDDFCVL